MHIQSLETITLLIPTKVATIATGGWVDLQGYLTDQNVKSVTLCGIGTTAGTAGGIIQTAEDTAGTGAATAKTLTGFTASGGTEEDHFVIKAGHRYIRYLPTTKSGKNMYLSCIIIAPARFIP